ncbi:GGDEF domain-containing protein [Acinetobacter sp. 194]|uniref:GGDEF domain-containing protein n=1 Tax=Acinetobacter shaoyimingii TaxID=2715164 RepID=UPI001409B4D9|nr:GGDEF domain-containing protein [Acinetobacter shaoyimingii]NHB59007.1 GGDEF domain-containing protein [Acinetobacter shaoyimingii]
MNLPVPDFLTAFGMSALTALTVAWVMWALGKQYWKQGMSWGIVSTLLYGCAYISFSIQNSVEWGLLHLISKLLISLGIATFSVALFRFCQSHQAFRDYAVILIPVIATLGIALLTLPQHLALFNSLQSAVTVFQTVYLLLILLKMRVRTPGTGWILVIIATIAHLATIVPLVFVNARPNPEFITQATMLDIIAMWMVCLVLFLKMVVTSFGFLIMLRDRQVALEQGKANLDFLTQLPNRATLVRALEHANFYAHQHSKPLSVMMVDIDHFKKFNDQYGHLAGDQVIQMVAQILQRECRQADIAARYGGEEFVVILPNTPLQGAKIVAERLCTNTRLASVEIDTGERLSVTISIGVHSCVPEHSHDWEPLVAAADQALYEAKRNGRNQVVFSNELN